MTTESDHGAPEDVTADADQLDLEASRAALDDAARHGTVPWDEIKDSLRLSGRDSDRFLDALDGEAEPNEALKRAAGRYETDVVRLAAEDE